VPIGIFRTDRAGASAFPALAQSSGKGAGRPRASIIAGIKKFLFTCNPARNGFWIFLPAARNGRSTRFLWV